MRHIGQSERNMLGFLAVKDRIEQLRLNHVHKVRQVQFICQKVSKKSRWFIKTRSSINNYFVPQVKGTEADTFFYKGLRDWNNLPENIKGIFSYNRFKYETKRFLVKRALNTE